MLLHVITDCMYTVTKNVSVITHNILNYTTMYLIHFTYIKNDKLYEKYVRISRK